MQYDNTPTVVCVLVQTVLGKLIAIRRNNEPGKGKIGLPGGYHMRGETWQQCGAREFHEETGLTIRPESLKLVSMETDEYGNNLVIAESGDRVPTALAILDSEEVQAVLALSHGVAINEDWAFPRHKRAVQDYLIG